MAEVRRVRRKVVEEPSHLTRKVRRIPRPADDIEEPEVGTPVAPSSNGTEKLVQQSATIKLDWGLFQGDTKRPCAIGIDASLSAFAIAAVSLDREAAYCWLYRSKTEGVRRLLQIETFIDWTLRTIKLQSGGVHHICMEGYGYDSPTGNAQAEIGGPAKMKIVSVFGWANEVAYPTLISPNTLKKWVTGRGSSEVKKNQMLLATYKKWDREFTDDNLCDAFGLAMLGAALATGHTDLSYERDVLQSLQGKEHTEWPRPKVSSTASKKRPTRRSSV